MASQRTLATKAWKHANGVESALKDLMNSQEFPLYEHIEDLIKQLRIASENTIFHDFDYAVTQLVEQKLWESHVLINLRYRKMLEAFRKQPEKKNHIVERRKLEKHYVDFIKTSQFFYKGYIQRLASHFGGLPGLRRIAHRMSLELLSADAPVLVQPGQEQQVEKSCYTSLLRLGDLSRYRNQVRTKDRSWDAAMGYYALANDLCPEKGNAYNQMAVIYLADGDHLNAVYHLFRSFAVKEDHELAVGNLNVEFKKVITASKQGRPQGKADAKSNLVWWFVLLHARFHEGQKFSTRKEMEDEVLSRVTLLLKGTDTAFKDVLEKLVMINMAAEDFALKRYTGGQTTETENAYYFCLEFNVRMLLCLLQVLSPELDGNCIGEELPKGPGEANTKSSQEKITTIAHRILPILRQYGSWLALKAWIIVKCAQKPDQTGIKLHSQELWNMYAIVLTKLANLFPVSDLPEVKYLFEEDEVTVGFGPLCKAETPTECNLFTDAQGIAKARTTDAGVQRNHPNIEMQARIRDIVLTAACLESKKMIPISLTVTADGRFVFSPTQDGMLMDSPQSSRNTESSRDGQSGTPTVTSDKTSGWGHKDGDHTSTTSWSRKDTGYTSTTESIDQDMSRMVDDLVEPRTATPLATNETSYGMHSRTANEVFAGVSTNGYEPHQHKTPKMLPTLSGGFYGTIFTPKKNELQAGSSRANGGRQLSPFSPYSTLSTSEKRNAAVHALDKMTGYSTARTPSGSSGQSQASPRSNTPQQHVNQMLQQLLQQQYLPYSSAFSDSSSLYGNTTHVRNKHSTGSARNGGFAATNGNSTIYPGASDFDRATMLQSSLWNGTPAGTRGYMQTPPGGQGG